MAAHLQQAEESDLAGKVRAYNSRCRSDSERAELSRDEEQRLVCHAPLRLHWDVRVQLALIDRDGSKPLNMHYYSGQLADDPQHQQPQLPTDASPATADDSVEVFAGVRLRRRSTKKQRQVIPVDWRRSVKGHAFTGPSSFQPECGQSVTVLADIRDNTQQVLASLFAKYMIRDSPDRFCVAVLASDGWELTLGELDCPLGIRLSLGPDEARAGKLVVREAGRPSPRHSVLELARLPTPLLHHLLESLDRELEADVALTRRRFVRARAAIEAAIQRLQRLDRKPPSADSGDQVDEGRTALREQMSHL